MKGNNELRLCEAEMMVALQIYIDHLMPNAEVKIKSVKQDNHGFIVKLTDEKGKVNA